MEILVTTSKLNFRNHIDHISARLGINRMGHLVEPGLYKLGEPGKDANVFVTANYTLSFDALRSELKGLDCYILILDTKGINVWCAAGKGTFGTEELVNRIDKTGLKDVVNHRRLILPQLGAPGVSAHRVAELTGFRIRYGPVLASDISGYLENGSATPAMRLVRFRLKDRIKLIPVEFVHSLIPLAVSGVLLDFSAGFIAALAAVSAILAGMVLFPVLLPLLPTRNFSTKGFFLGTLVAAIFAGLNLFYHPDFHAGLKILTTVTCFLVVPPVTAFLSLNFTGSTTFTSRTGVRKEIFSFFPAMVWLFGSGVVTFIVTLIIYYTGY